MDFYRTLSFHVERTQPLSDLFGAQDGTVFLTSERPVEVTLSLMTSRGLSHVENVVLNAFPTQLYYDPPWGRDWVVMQIQPTLPLSLSEAPYEVKLYFEPKKVTTTKIERLPSSSQQTLVPHIV